MRGQARRRKENGCGDEETAVILALLGEAAVVTAYGGPAVGTLRRGHQLHGTWQASSAKVTLQML